MVYRAVQSCLGEEAFLERSFLCFWMSQAVLASPYCSLYPLFSQLQRIIAGGVLSSLNSSWHFQPWERMERGLCPCPKRAEDIEVSFWDTSLPRVLHMPLHHRKEQMCPLWMKEVAPQTVVSTRNHGILWGNVAQAKAIHPKGVWPQGNWRRRPGADKREGLQAQGQISSWASGPKPKQASQSLGFPPRLPVCGPGVIRRSKTWPSTGAGLTSASRLHVSEALQGPLVFLRVDFFLH